MKRILTIMFLSTVMCMPLAHAQEEEAKDRGFEERQQKMFDSLQLSDEQKKLIEANRERNKNSRKEMWDQMKATMQALGEELKKSELDMPKITSLQEQRKQLMERMAEKRFESILQVRNILTKEQFQQFIEMTEKQREERRSK